MLSFIATDVIASTLIENQEWRRKILRVWRVGAMRANKKSCPPVGSVMVL